MWHTSECVPVNTPTTAPVISLEVTSYHPIFVDEEKISAYVRDASMPYGKAAEIMCRICYCIHGQITSVEVFGKLTCYIIE